MQQTGNPLDVAIDGKAFLVVQTPRGERYTRNGALQINATGHLVTSEGHPRARRIRPDPVPDRPTATSPSAATASIAVPGRRSRGKLRLVSFDSRATPAEGRQQHLRGAERTWQPRAAEFAHVIQGSIEKSNVRGVIEMTRMIEITRTYTQIASLLQQQTEQRRSAIEQLAEVPA